MDQLDPNDTVAATDTKAIASPSAPPATGGDAPEPLDHATPLGLRSSPPPLRVPTNVSSHRAASHAGSVAGSQSDSEAETVVLPGVDGYSPSKIRKERNIKLEDKGVESSQDRAIQANAPRNVGDERVDKKRKESTLPSENAASLLGKRKRSKHGISRLDDNHGGNSSGLSSVPTSPVAHARSNLGKRVESDSDEYRSSSPRKAGSEKAARSKRSTESNSDRDKEFKRTHARRSSARETAGSERYGERRTKLPGESSTRRRRTHSPSPTHDRENPGNLSGHRAASSGAANGLSTRKKSIPPPLRPIKSNQSAESDDSSAIESPYPRRSKTRHQGTPPIGGSMQKMAHRRRQNRYGRTPLADASEAGDLERVKQLLEEFPEDLDVPDAAGNTPLQCAALNGHAAIVDYLLKFGCNTECKNNDGDSPLLDAVENSHLDVVKLLLDAGVDPRARNQRGEEPIVKVDEDADDAEAIRAALHAAKSAHAARLRPLDSAHTPQHEPTQSTNRQSMSHGRADRTGHGLLYTQFDIPSLRDAAAKGDTQRVVSILLTLGNVDDAEATLSAAKGGHLDALEMMFGLGNANPDPEPLKSAPSWEFATPMLAAIGGNNIKIVELLLQQAKDRKFDPTRRFKGKTYFEIAKERAGPVWVEEERLLKQAYDEYASRSPVASRSNGRARHDDSKHSRSKPSSTREMKGPDMSSPVRRAPGRSRKDNVDDAEDDLPSTTSQRDDEAEQAKPRRKLVSGRELKDAAHEKNKPSSTTGSPPNKFGLGHRDHEAPVGKKTSDPDAMEGVESTHLAPERPAKREKSRERPASVRDLSPAKRIRQTSPTPSEPAELGTKRRRVEAETKKRRQSDVGQGTAAEKRIPSTHIRDRVHKDKLVAPKESDPQETTVRRGSGDKHALKDVENARPTRSSPGKVRSKPLSPAAEDDTTEYIGQKRKADADMEAEVKAAVAAATAKRRETDRQNEEAARKADAEKRAEAEAEAKRKEEDRKAKHAELQSRREKETLLALAHADPSAETADLIEGGNLLHTKESRQEALQITVSREEQARREIEEAAERERQRREASAENHRQEEARIRERAAEEERKRLAREEMERRQIQERERKIHEKQQERARLKKEREEARLAKLPPLLRWWEETNEPLDTVEIAEAFNEMYAPRYDTIVLDESKRDPNIDGREQYILNTQAAGLLGEKDLELTRYTTWDRVPATKSALHGLWRIQHFLYAMTWPPLEKRNPAFADYYQRNPPTRPPPVLREREAIKDAAQPLFINSPLFFVKVADVMSQVPRKPHLRDMKMHVWYHEACLDEAHALNPQLTKVSKWRSDNGADQDGWCPGKKIYQNGVLVYQYKPVTVVWDHDNPKFMKKNPQVVPPPAVQQQETPKPSETGHGEALEVENTVVASSSPAPHVRRPLPTNARSSAPTTAPAPVPTNVPASAPILIPTNTNGNNNSNNTSDTNMNGHFAGDFAGYSMHGATGSRPNSSSGPNGWVNAGGDPSHPAHPSLPTFRTLTESPGMFNGGKGEGEGKEKEKEKDMEMGG